MANLSLHLQKNPGIKYMMSWRYPNGGFQDGLGDQGIVFQIVFRRPMMAFPNYPSMLISVPNMERKLGVAYNHWPCSFKQDYLDFRLMAPWATSFTQTTETASMPNPVRFAIRF